MSNNTVRENSSYGIYASGDVNVTANTVFDNVTGTGIEILDGTAANNEVYGNLLGIYSGDPSSTVAGNRVYDNSDTGILAYAYSSIQGNYVYSNGVGIQTAYNNYWGGPFAGTISDNLVYANVDGGIEVANASGLGGEQHRLRAGGRRPGALGGSNGVRIENNILWVEAGYDIDVADDSQSGLASDYNLFNKGTDPNAHVGYYGGIEDTFADWQAIGQDAHSVAGNPNFVAISAPTTCWATPRPMAATTAARTTTSTRC